MCNYDFASVLLSRPCVLRGNVRGHRLPGCRCVGPTRMSGPLMTGVCHIRLSLEFGPYWLMCMLVRYCDEFRSTLVVKGGLDQHIWLL